MILRNIFVYPQFPENLQKLYQLTYNLWFTWNYDAISLFYRIDAPLFRKVNHNPVRFLHSLSKEKIDELSKDKGFRFELDKVWGKFNEYMQYAGTVRAENGTEVALGPADSIAYFSMEFGLHECVPIYAGGLGILAGDFLKSASDMGLPVVGVGLLYKYGYFTQHINMAGLQEEVFSDYEKHLLPMKSVRGADGEPAYVTVRMLDRDVKIKVWRIDVGATKLILLDTDLPENPPDLRSITDELYVAERQERIMQEIVLGLGGIKALAAAGVTPKVYHLNEGHSAFLVVARLQELMKEKGLSFSEARAVIRASTVFTTHTPVIAGNENFDAELVRRFLDRETKHLGISFDELASLGFVEGKTDIFWLPSFAIRFARYVNGVSRAHMNVSRRMWSVLFPERSVAEIPIDHVTNGVHMSWVSEVYSKILERYIGPDYIRSHGEAERLWQRILDVPDEEIWEAHRKNKKDLVTFIRRKLADDLAARGYSQAKFLLTARVLNPEYLTVVFARRFAHYKRATLLLKNRDRLVGILSNAEKPVQLIFAGKAHPADEGGKNMIKEIIDFAKERNLEDRVIFLENYDMNVARHLVWGADVWLNVPGKDMEASGTSGMKAAMNGVLQLSGLEGWWAEGYNGRNGWSITAGEFYRNSDMQDQAEANQVYDFLEDEITEAFYRRNESGMPEEWVRMMKESISSVCAHFNMNRVLASYVKKFYLPAKAGLEAITADNFQKLKDAMALEREILKTWKNVKITAFTTDVDMLSYLVEGRVVNAECVVALGNAAPELYCVELFYQYRDQGDHEIIPMSLTSNQGGVAQYRCAFETRGSGLQHINARIRPAGDIIQDLHPEMIRWKD